MNWMQLYDRTATTCATLCGGAFYQAYSKYWPLPVTVPSAILVGVVSATVLGNAKKEIGVKPAVAVIGGVTALIVCQCGYNQCTKSKSSLKK